ncbi:FIG00450475: hypothetical protein [hydrothermal vent metagenome]|uniref:Uncharacterized protein n=1 Tax=hydrothermal vent metagenome TaxID=652676 RepID=A0A3B0TG37_9ZZZZ
MPGTGKDPSKLAPDRLVGIALDDSLAATATADVAHERQVAIFDLIEENKFDVVGDISGPFHLTLSIVEKRLVFDIKTHEHGRNAGVVHLSMTPFRRIVRDYFMVCETYYQAIRTAPASRIEAIDMGRRGLHDEGSQVLLDRLDGKIDMDFTTARRLFTLICALHWKG